MQNLATLIFIFSSFITFGQNEWWNTESKATDTTISNSFETGKVTINKDGRLDKMLDFKATTIPPAYAPQINGYRVQLFFDSDKNKVNQARATFLTAYPKEDTYIEFKAPNFHLKAGNFRNQLDAERLKSQLIQYFPTCIVVPEKVYFPKVETSEED